MEFWKLLKKIKQNENSKKKYRDKKAKLKKENTPISASSGTGFLFHLRDI